VAALSDSFFADRSAAHAMSALEADPEGLLVQQNSADSLSIAKDDHVQVLLARGTRHQVLKTFHVVGVYKKRDVVAGATGPRGFLGRPSGRVRAMGEAIKIIVLDGDETGQELLEQAIRVLDPALLELELELEHFDLSLENRRATKNQVVIEAAAAMREAGLGLKAATITPEGAHDVGSPNRILREEVDGKVIVRTGRRLPGVAPIAGVHYPISVVRMAVEDAYGAKEWREGDAGSPSEVAYRTEHVTRSTCRAVAEYAFRTGGKMNARVYGGPKWTVSPVYEGLLKEELDDAAERHAGVAYQPVLIDATYAGLLSGATDAPLVIPALNRDGDCLSDLVLPMFGSIAGAESVLLAFDENYDTTVAMAEAPHGTAPALHGKDLANPLAMILACGAVLHHAADRSGPNAERASRAIYEAALETVASGVKTPDLGGHAGTTEFTTAVVERVRTKIEIWSSLGSAA
jgi:isocitrate/isopropylmalate dehydrogenase